MKWAGGHGKDAAKRGLAREWKAFSARQSPSPSLLERNAALSVDLAQLAHNS